MTEATFRVGILNTHPIQYFGPLYAYLNKANDLDITVLYMSDASIRGELDRGFGHSVKWDVDLLSGYQSFFLGSAAQRRVPGGFFSLIAPEVWPAVTLGRYDALIVHGHNYAGNLIAILAAKLTGTRVMMRCETHLQLQRNSITTKLRRLILGALYRLVDSCLAIGSANATFYKAMGVPSKKIFLVPYTVDNDRFTAAAALEQEEKHRIRSAFGIRRDSTVVLCVSKFQRRKRPQDLIEASHKLAAQGLKFEVLMVGTGAMEEELQKLAKGGPADIRFGGFVNQSELTKVYSACDIFALPSENEPWGLVINEAMCAGLPVVASEEIGAVADLVLSGSNGETFKARDVHGLASALHPIIADPVLRAQMSDASRARIATWSYTECLNGIRQALKDDPACPQPQDEGPMSRRRRSTP